MLLVSGDRKRQEHKQPFGFTGTIKVFFFLLDGKFMSVKICMLKLDTNIVIFETSIKLQSKLLEAVNIFFLHRWKLSACPPLSVTQ